MAELKDGTKKIGGSSPPGSTMDIEIFDEIDRVMVNWCPDGPRWLGWAGWLAGCRLKSFIMLKDKILNYNL